MAITCFIRYRIDPHEKNAFAQSERFLLREERIFFVLASAPHALAAAP